MQLNNEKEMNPNTHLTSLSSTTGSTTSADSGVIIIDNTASFNHTNNYQKNSNTEATRDKVEVETEEGQPTKDWRGSIGGGQTSKTNQRSFRDSTNSAQGKATSIEIENTLNINGNPTNPTTYNKQQRGPTVSSKKCSPTLSIRSTTISIVSIDENAIDSSVVDSDSELEADAEGEHTNYTVKKLGQQMTYPPNSPDLPSINHGLKVISQQIRPNGDANCGGGPTALAGNIINGNLCVPTTVIANGQTPPPLTPNGGPQIGSIALTNSTDVTFGDKHFYEGPVTIQQFLIDSRDKWKAQNGDDEDGRDGGQDNPNYTGPTSNGGPATKMNQPQNQTPPSLPHTISRKAIWITTIFVLLTIIIGATIAMTTNIFEAALKQKRKLQHQLEDEDSRQNIPINSTIGQDNIGSGRILRVVPRDAWLAQPPQQEIPALNTPIGTVVAIPTQTEDCTGQAACVFRVRFLQTFDIESQQQFDISYNFLIGSDGNVYEGRGWDKQGAHSKGYNELTLSIAYIGTYLRQPPGEKQLSVTKLLLDKGVQLGKLKSDYKFVGGNKLEPESSRMKAPMLYDSFKDWPHWSNELNLSNRLW